MADAWPTHSQELGRKAIETLHTFAHRRNTGKIDDATFALVCTVLLDTTQGLIPSDDFDVIYRVRKSIWP